jgi:hypothetical protein
MSSVIYAVILVIILVVMFLLAPKFSVLASKVDTDLEKDMMQGSASQSSCPYEQSGRSDSSGRSSYSDSRALVPNKRSGGELEDATRNSWMETTDSSNNSQNYHQSRMTDQVADSRMKTQHRKWVSEVAPKSQTAMAVDNMDEASALSTWNGHGLRTYSMRAPKRIGDPMYILEGTDDFDSQRTRFQL